MIQKIKLHFNFKSIILSLILALITTFGLIWLLLQPPVVGGDFELSHRGTPWKFSDHAKKLNLLYIGYVKCPDVCPFSLAAARDAFDKLSDEEKTKVQLIFISVDAAHDTAQSVADYASAFNPGFIGLTGSKQQVDLVIQQFGASYVVENEPKSYLGYSIAHTDKVFFLRRKGYVVETIHHPRESEPIVETIRRAL